MGQSAAQPLALLCGALCSPCPLLCTLEFLFLSFCGRSSKLFPEATTQRWADATVRDTTSKQLGQEATRGGRGGSLGQTDSPPHPRTQASTALPWPTSAATSNL